MPRSGYVLQLLTVKARSYYPNVTGTIVRILVELDIMAQTQKILRFTQAGPISTSLSLTNAPIPSAGPRQALVRVHASAINPSDILNVEGKFQQTTFSSHGRVPGRDFAGTVVTGPKQFDGKRVWGTGGVNGFVKDGTHAEYIVVEEDALADMEMPSGMSFSQAAACGVGFLTAATMVEKAAPKEGEHVLVLGLCNLLDLCHPFAQIIPDEVANA